MNAPAVRYPVFWLLGLLVLGVTFRLGWPLTLPVRVALAERWRRIVEGPPVPASSTPMRLVGPIVRRGLLLRENTPVTDLPEGTVIETVRRRVFVDIYDTWPLPESEPTTHYRVGNDRPFGWVRAADLLPWSTRLALRVPESGLPADPTLRPPGPRPDAAILPVLDWDADALRVAVWAEDHAWSSIDRIALVPIHAAPRSTLGVLLTRGELVQLLREALDAESLSGLERLRLRAVFGLLVEGRALDSNDPGPLSGFLPAGTFPDPPTLDAIAPLADINANWQADVEFSRVGYRFLPLDALP